MFKYRWLWSLLIIAVAAGILLPLSPLYRPVPDVDQSVYLYVSSRMLEGQAPYQDAWDHKQPLTYFIYAAGLALSNGSLWGIWVIELIFLALTGLLGFHLLRRLTSPLISFLSAAAALLTLFLIIWGYSVEELALPFQTAALVLFAGYLNTHRPTQKMSYSFGLGLLLGITFFLKQSLIAVALSVLLVLAVRIITRRQWINLLHLAVAGTGFAVVAALLLAYLAFNGALQAYWNAAFAFNLSYANLGTLERLSALLNSVEYVSTVPGLFVALVLWIVVVVVVLLQNGPRLAGRVQHRLFRPAMLLIGALLVLACLAGEWIGSEPGLGLVQQSLLFAGVLFLALGLVTTPRRLRLRMAALLHETPLLPDLEKSSSGRLLSAMLSLSALAFPLTLLLMTLSGRSYVYYFIPLVPLLLLLLGLTGGVLTEASASPRGRKLASVLIFALCAGLAFNPLLLLSSAYRKPLHPQPPAIGAYISTHTSAQDTILAWGKYTTYAYYVSGRKAPTRYFYQAPLDEESYNARFHVSDEVLRSLQEQKPVLFLIGDSPGAPAGPKPLTCPANNPIIDYVCSHYQYNGNVDEFQVYQLVQ